MSSTTKQDRIASVDALRGFAMFWLIGGQALLFALAEYLGSPHFKEYVEREFEHPPWSGFCWWDVVMPTFIFVSGVTIPLSITRRVERGESKLRLYGRILRRLLVLMVLNVIAYGALNTLDFNQMRYTGVLARIGISYSLAAMIAIHTTPRRQFAWAAGILAGYWAAMKFIPVPGFGAGSMDPLQNLAGYLDRHLMPGLIMGGMYDRLGLYSTLPTISTVLIGVLAGHWLFSNRRSAREKLLGLLAAGVACRLAGALAAIFFPINTKVWSPSYVLSAGGWSLIFLAIFFLVIDVWRIRSWAFAFVLIGMNSLTIYFGQNFVDFDVTAKYFFGGLANLAPAAGGAVVLAIGVLAVKWALLYFLYRKDIYFRA